jgi:hypothetical protein
MSKTKRTWSELFIRECLAEGIANRLNISREELKRILTKGDGEIKETEENEDEAETTL